jgi:hypothetical protein
MTAPEISTNSRALIRPVSVLAGVAIGLILLSIAGRLIVKRDWHKEYFRLHTMQAPDSQYEPTIEEMQAIVRARCRADQVLVIVGGNSILVGVGQPESDLWTRHLQAKLGNRYAVFNFALRGASPTDGGAILAESLRHEFPKQIYIANAPPMKAADAIGGDSYRIFLYDAYYKGLLLPWDPRDTDLRLRANRPADKSQYFEIETAAKLDACFRFRNLWNWWTMTKVSTFGTERMPTLPKSFWPRNRFKDEEPDYDSLPFRQRFTPETVKADLNITQQVSAVFYFKSPDGKWAPNQPAHDEFRRFARRAFPDELKKRTLILISLCSPFYTNQLPPDIKLRDELAVRDTIRIWQELGYDAVPYGNLFAADDFGDRSHLTKRGGKKLADITAAKVSEMAVRLGYLENAR